MTNVDKLAITVPYGEGFKEKLHDTDVRANCGMCNQRNIIKTICKRIRIGLVHEDMGYTITKTKIHGHSNETASWLITLQSSKSINVQ